MFRFVFWLSTVVCFVSLLVVWLSLYFATSLRVYHYQDVWFVVSFISFLVTLLSLFVVAGFRDTSIRKR